jgi:hypothetical protein
MKVAPLYVLALALAGANLASAQSSDNHDLELKACGPKDKEVNYSEKADHKQHPLPQPDAGKALVYVLRPTRLGFVIQTKVAVDGDWKGVNRGDTYFFFQLDPGDHAVCSVAENHSVLQLTVEAGKTYYLQQHIETGVMKARNEIAPMPEDEAKQKLANLDLATWQVK